MARPEFDLVLLNPSSRLEVYQALGNELSAIEPPVWAGLMAEFVRRKGHRVAIVDAEAEHLTVPAIAQRIAEMNPRLVAIPVYGHQPSASTQNMTAASRCATAIKQSLPATPLLLLGGHVAALPVETLRGETADYVCGGEGFYTLQAMLESLKAGKLEVEKVPDLYYRDGDQVRHTPAAPLVKDLDAEVPGIAWDLLPMERYRAHNWHCFGHLTRQPYAALYTTLGCPFHCSFCCIQAPFRSGEKTMGLKETVNSYRFWSPQRIGDDLEMLVNKYGVYNVKFADEMFVLNPRHVDGICNEIIRRGLKLNIWAYARVDTVRDNMPEKLLQAGFRWLAFGVEAANAKVRDDVQKGFGQPEIAETINRVRESGIYVIANYIFGLPEDDLATMQETLDLALDLNAEFANFYCAMAYPGSPLYLTALKEGWALPPTWTGYSQHSVDMLPLRTKHLSAAEVIRFRDDAFHTYFSSPRYLEMVERRFGPDTVAHIQQMAVHRLERKYAK